MRKCKRDGCVNIIEPNGSRTNNKKFCSPECCDLNYKTVNAARIKANYDRNNAKKYNQYAEGKEKCVLCDGWYFAICHHAVQKHGLSEHEYKRMIGADVSKGRLPEQTKRIKRAHVFENGTVENLKKGAHKRYVKGDQRAGNYQRSAETLIRLKANSLRLAHKSGR